MGKFLDNTGLTQVLTRLKQYFKPKVIDSKTYENLICASNTQAAGVFYFMAVRPDNYMVPARIKFRVTASINNASTASDKTYYHQECISEMVLSGNTLLRYSNSNAFHSGSYKPFVYLDAYRMTQTGYNAGKSHYIGLAIYNSTLCTNTNYKRDLKIELLECSECTVTFPDTALLSSGFYSSANYAGLSLLDINGNGSWHSGDANTYDRTVLSELKLGTTTTMYGTQLILSADGVDWFSICNSRSTATNKTCATQGFLPEHIKYYSGSSTRVNTTTSTWEVYNNLPINLLYSSNLTNLQIGKPVYLVCNYDFQFNLYTLVQDGWITQTIPEEASLKLYVLLGYAYSATNIYLMDNHPVFSNTGYGIKEEGGIPFRHIELALFRDDTYEADDGGIKLSISSADFSRLVESGTSFSIMALELSNINITSPTYLCLVVDFGNSNLDYITYLQLTIDLNCVVNYDNNINTYVLPSAIDLGNIHERLNGIPKTLVLTQAEYDALDPKDPDTLYYIQDETGQLNYVTLSQFQEQSVKIQKTTDSAYNALQTKDPLTIYYTTI